MQRSPKQHFDLEARLLDTPRIRKQVGPLLHGWSIGQHRDTRRGRYIDLHQFAAFVLNEDIPPPHERDDIRAAAVMLVLLRARSGRTAVADFLDWLTARKYKPETQRRKMKTLRLWARYLYEKRAAPRHLDMLPIPSVASLKTQAEPPTTPALAAITEESADAEHLSPEAQTRARRVLEARNRAIVDLLTHSSLDRAQILELTWGNVDFGQHPVLEGDDALAPPARVQVPRRDGRQYWRHLAPHATSTMRRWNRAYVSHFLAALPDRPVFSTLAGKRLSPSRIYEITDG